MEVVEIKLIKDGMRKVLIILREMSIYMASLFAWFIYNVFIRTGEYFLVDAVIFIPLIAMVISNIFATFKYKKYIGKASIIGAVMGLMIIIGANEMVCMQYTDFSSEKWKNDMSVRHFMIEDLTKNYLKENLSATEVEALLGDYYIRVENEGALEETISYYYSYDGYHERVSKNMYLDIYFNSENKIVSWELYEEAADWL